MYGHGYPPPQQQRPGQGLLIGLRVLFVALPLLTCGFLAWAPLLRLACVTRKKLDWALFGVFLAADTALLTFIVVTAEEKASDLESFLGVGAMMALVLGSVSYYLVAEIQHYARGFGPAPVVPPPVTGGYGYPPTAVTAPSPGVPQPYPTPQPYATPRPQPIPQTQTQPPAGQPQPRIDQVRAELDELSDLLRKEPREPREPRDPRDPRDGGR